MSYKGNTTKPDITNDDLKSLINLNSTDQHTEDLECKEPSVKQLPAQPIGQKERSKVKTIFRKRDNMENKERSDDRSTNTNTNTNTNKSTDTHTNTVLSSKDILNTIPRSATTEKREDLTKTVEWRWRFFNINGRKLIELSYLAPNCPRIYTDYMGNRIEYDLDEKWDAYVVKTLYAYANI